MTKIVHYFKLKTIQDLQVLFLKGLGSAGIFTVIVFGVYLFLKHRTQ